MSNKPQDENVNERILEELKLIRRHLIDSASFSDDVAVTAAEALAEQLDQSDIELSTLHKDIATLNTRVEELTASTKEIGNSSQALENLTTGLIVLTVWLIVLATSSFIVDAQSHGLIPNTFSAWVFDLFLISVVCFCNVVFTILPKTSEA